MTGKKQGTTKERLWNLSVPEPNSGCHLFTGSWVNEGYGQIRVDGQTLLAHRVSWAEHIGEIPDGAHVLHRCDTPCCVNPGHLFLGTIRENALDMVNKKRQWKQVISIADVPKIRADPRSYKTIGDDYGISKSQVFNIKRERCYKHIRTP